MESKAKLRRANNVNRIKCNANCGLIKAKAMSNSNRRDVGYNEQWPYSQVLQKFWSTSQYNILWFILFFSFRKGERARWKDGHGDRNVCVEPLAGNHAWLKYTALHPHNLSWESEQYLQCWRLAQQHPIELATSFFYIYYLYTIFAVRAYFMRIHLFMHAQHTYKVLHSRVNGRNYFRTVVYI